MDATDGRKYYRNNLDIQTLFDLIESDSLWYMEMNDNGDAVMILVDEDRHAEFPYSPTMFREVTINVK